MNIFEFTVDVNDFDLANWIRRFDKDVDGKLQFVDLVNALSTMTSYQAKAVTQANAERTRFSLNQPSVQFDDGHADNNIFVDDPFSYEQPSLIPATNANVMHVQDHATLPTFGTGEIVQINT